MTKKIDEFYNLYYHNIYHNTWSYDIQHNFMLHSTNSYVHMYVCALDDNSFIGFTTRFVGNVL